MSSCRQKKLHRVNISWDKIYRSTFDLIEDISIVFLQRIWLQSVRKKKVRQKYGLFMQNKCFYRILSFHGKKNRHSWRLNNSNKVFLNQWESVDFHKLILKFCKSCNETGQKHFGPYLKNKVFLIQSLEWELQECLFKISSKNQMAQFFEKTKKTFILALPAEI